MDRFLAFAASRPDLVFEVTPIGCGLSGFTPAAIGPMFRGAPGNCRLPASFQDVLDATCARRAPASFPAIHFHPPHPER